MIRKKVRTLKREMSSEMDSQVAV